MAAAAVSVELAPEQMLAGEAVTLFIVTPAITEMAAVAVLVQPLALVPVTV